MEGYLSPVRAAQLHSTPLLVHSCRANGSLLLPLPSHRTARGGSMVAVALRCPPLLRSHTMATTTAGGTRRTASTTLRVAPQPESASASTSTSDAPPEFSPLAGFTPPVHRRFTVKDGLLIRFVSLHHIYNCSTVVHKKTEIFLHSISTLTGNSLKETN